MNKIPKYGLDSICYGLVVKGLSDTEILAALNEGKHQEKRVSMGDVCEWRKKVEKSIEEAKDD